MDSLLNGRVNEQFDHDDKKRFLYNNTRRHFSRLSSASSSSSSTQPSLRSIPPLTKRVATITGILLTIFYIAYFGNFTSSSSDTTTDKSNIFRNGHKQLSDQPVYKRHEGTCSAILCNPVNKCSTWKPNHRYDWSQLSKAGIFRDLGKIQLSPGCDLKIKVGGAPPAAKMSNSEDMKRNSKQWITIPEGLTECTDDSASSPVRGYGVKCRNFVAMELTANIATVAKQMKRLMTQDTANEGQEIILVEHSYNNAPSVEGDQTNVNKLDITMISQFTVNRLGTFAKAIEKWPGPISIAIYLTDTTDIDDLLTYFEDEENVKTYARVTIALVKPNYLDTEHLAYPINHLRNIAITESATDYIFVMDADFTPSSSLYPIARQRLIPYILHNGASMPRTAWVVPCFAIYESYSDLPLPETLRDLRHLVRQNIAYITDPGAGHGPTLATEVAIVRPLSYGNPLAYEVCYESQWEPYYILHRSAPLYDVRFRNQGGDKQSHALQLNAEKYRFMVLRDVFMVHKDHPTMIWPGGGFDKSQKEAAIKWNYFEEYKEEIENLYGINARWPKGCSAAAIGWQEQRRDILGIAAGAI